jgi:hypothetical protein
VPSNYEAIRKENRDLYGTDIGRIGPMLLSHRYDDRTHFIFELLQNAEDALSRRSECQGQRHVTFTLEPGRLTLSHFGRPFDEADVRSICAIALSKKDGASIGRFGIGFKSVYTFTDRPEIHSGDEAFAVENYVHPISVAPVARQPDETLVILPLKQGDKRASDEILTGLKRIGPNALLFLQQIEEINWRLQDGSCGSYLRSPPQAWGENVHKITVIGKVSGEPEVDENWLVFDRVVFSPDKEAVGRVQVAFSLKADGDQTGQWTVAPVNISPLVVFFPTAVETNLGFLVQGPYRTTPSRDNIPRDDPWNKHLIGQTAELLVEAIRWLRDEEMLDISALHCMPLDPEKFTERSMFGPVFELVRQALFKEPLLPRFGGGYVAASHSKLARTQELRELFHPTQVAKLFGSAEAAWLTGEISQDRTPAIRQYVMRELRVVEVTPEVIIPRLTQTFLEAQSDEWVSRLYEFLSAQPSLYRRLNFVPLIRLSDDHHIVARITGEPRPQAFLPGNFETGFPTVKPAVCASQKAREFLMMLGITEPDLVDDVIRNVLQKYLSDSVDEEDDQYTKDIKRILAAFQTDSKTQRERLLAALRKANFVMAVDAGDGSSYLDKPGNVYIATERLKKLFANVPGAMIVNDAYACLRGERVRDLLEACGAVRYPRPVEIPHAMSLDTLRALRQWPGHEKAARVYEQVVDWLLQGVDELIRVLPNLTYEERGQRARLLWDSLGELEERRGGRIFEGSYQWGRYGQFRKAFPSAFVRRLNDAAWIPAANGEIYPPHLVVFDSLGWNSNPFLLTKIRFKPPIIDKLAREAGIDPAALDLLRECGITTVEVLRSRLGIPETPVQQGQSADTEPSSKLERTDANDSHEDTKDFQGDAMPDPPPGIHDPEDHDSPAPHGRGASSGKGGGQGAASKDGGGGNGSPTNTEPSDTIEATHRPPGGRNGVSMFISYVGMHPDHEEADPDGLEREARMRIEAQAIKKILQLEPFLRQTPEGNPGYDLYEPDATGSPIRWVEVKSMTGSLEDRPVGLSHTQFDLARVKADAYWLYVVEHAMDPQRARVLRIRNPAGKARTFTLDRGWSRIAQPACLT